MVFADLKGSLELLADRDPEEARALLDPVVELMMECVHRFEGTVSHVLGDGIMALFGAPLAHEDHAVRACYASLAMQEAIRRHNEGVRRSLGIELQIRIGVNSGEVVVRSINNDLHMDYSAIGQTTHLAARMEQLAVPGTIRITADTLRLAEEFVRVKPLGPVPVKGLREPIEVFELVGAAPMPRRWQARAARGLTPFVGREIELEALRQALERGRARQGQLVAIVGEAGVGKSRLVWEITHSHRAEGWLVLECGTVSYGAGTAYLPVRDLLRSYFHVDDQDSTRIIREKVTGKLLTLDRSLEPALLPLLAVMDVEVEDREWNSLHPTQLRQRTLEAVKRLLLVESERQPLCLVFEDLHWVDSETQALLDGLVANLPLARMVIMITYRPDYQHRWSNQSGYPHLDLTALPTESAEALLDSLLGDNRELVSIKNLLINHTEGNPFFLEECVRTLFETKVLVRNGSTIQLTNSPSTIQVPASVEAVLATRIDRLTSEQKRLLQCAAVVGKHVSHGLLQAVADMPEESLRLNLDYLQGAEFLYRASLFPEVEYAFTHSLTHDVAYGSLLQERRRSLHARILEALEAMSASQTPQPVDRLAHHALHGEVWERAAEYFRQAGATAAARSANREAAAAFENALLALAHLPSSSQTMTLGIDLHMDLRNCLLLLGHSDQMLKHLREAERLAEELGDDTRLGWVCSYLTHHGWWRGDPEDAIVSGERALAIATRTADQVLEVLTRFHLGQAYHSLGKYPRALEFLGAIVVPPMDDVMREKFGVLYSVRARSWMTWCCAELGEFTRGIESGQQAIHMAEAVDQPFSLITAFLGLGLLYLRKGEHHKAIPILERGLALSQARDLPVLFPTVASRLGLAYAYADRLTEGLVLLERALDRATSMSRSSGQSLRLAHLGEAYLVAGRISEARGVAHQAIRVADEHKEAGYRAWALRLLGEAAGVGDTADIEASEHAFRESSSLAQVLGMRPLTAHVNAGMARLCRARQRYQEAEGCLRSALALFEELGMDFWTQRTRREFEAAPSQGS